jgi:hypothetical protein
MGLSEMKFRGEENNRLKIITLQEAPFAPPAAFQRHRANHFLTASSRGRNSNICLSLPQTFMPITQ